VRLVYVLRLTMILAALGVLVAGPAACIKAPTSPTTTPAFSHTDVRVGTGAEAVSGSVITVNYTGWLYDPSKADSKGGQFDSSIGTEPFTFTLGSSSVIAGWDQGLVGMKVGGIRRLVIPPSLAYGGSRVSAIPANATILFDVELISLE
jgi:FKBP-type peptidyl-prolyl cis-trans isomerase FkpA